MLELSYFVIKLFLPASPASILTKRSIGRPVQRLAHGVDQFYLCQSHLSLGNLSRGIDICSSAWYKGLKFLQNESSQILPLTRETESN